MSGQQQEIIVVSGGSSGIGWACVQEIASHGYLPVIVDMQAPPQAQFPYYRCDVSDERQVEELWKELDRFYPHVYGLVNAAGIVDDRISWKMTAEQFMRVVRVNLLGVFLMCREAIRRLRHRGRGRIVNIGSRVWKGNIGQANYAASKAGVVALTRTLAMELLPYGITVNCVAPGPTDTPMFRSLPQQVQEKLIAAQPSCRLVEPVEVARAVWFFLDPRGGFITGQLLYVDHGKSLFG